MKLNIPVNVILVGNNSIMAAQELFLLVMSLIEKTLIA